jgi:hypothetical protein
MSDAAMYDYIKKLVHSLLKSTRKKEQKAAEKAAQKAAEKTAQKAAEKGPRQQKQRPELEDDGWTIVTYSKSRRKHPHTVSEKRVSEKRGHHIVMKYNQRNKEKTHSSISSCSSLVVNPKTHLTAVLTHPDTKTQMSVANNSSKNSRKAGRYGQRIWNPGAYRKTLLCTTTRKQEHIFARDRGCLLQRSIRSRSVS